MEHLKKETLYFYLKNDLNPEEKDAVSAHLASCDKCLTACEKVKAMSGMIRKPMLEPPVLDLGRKPKSSPAFKRVFFRPAFAAAFAAIMIVSGILVGKLAIRDDSGKKVSDFVYKTYSTVYDDDYYRSNFMDDTDLLYEER